MPITPYGASNTFTPKLPQPKPKPTNATPSIAPPPNTGGDLAPTNDPGGAVPATPMGAIPVPGGLGPTVEPTNPTTTPGGTSTLNPRAIPATPQTPTTALPVPGGIQPTIGSTTPGNPVTLTPTDPNNPRTGQTITPGATADRFQVAMDRWNQFEQGSAPAYQAALRDAKRVGAT